MATRRVIHRPDLAPEYERALRLFDPRRGADDEGVRLNLVEMPLLAADLTFAKLRHGRVYSAMSDWEEDREPVVGETVLVADGEGRPFEAKLERIDQDGTIVLTVLAFAA